MNRSLYVLQLQNKIHRSWEERYIIPLCSTESRRQLRDPPILTIRPSIPKLEKGAADCIDENGPKLNASSKHASIPALSHLATRRTANQLTGSFPGNHPLDSAACSTISTNLSSNSYSTQLFITIQECGRFDNRNLTNWMVQPDRGAKPARRSGTHD